MSAIDDLRQTMARLRAPDGCPWDREQNHQTLTRCLIDECSELLETIDQLDLPHMREELGDVLVQVIFHAQLAAERAISTSTTLPGRSTRSWCAVIPMSSAPAA